MEFGQADHGDAKVPIPVRERVLSLDPGPYFNVVGASGLFFIILFEQCSPSLPWVYRTSPNRRL